MICMSVAMRHGKYGKIMGNKFLINNRQAGLVCCLNNSKVVLGMPLYVAL